VNNTNNYNCTPGLVPDSSPSGVSFFSMYLDQITIQYGNTYGQSQSHSAVCPYVFTGAQIASIELNYQVDSFLFVSLLRFQQDTFNIAIKNKTTGFSINSVINYLNILSGYNYKLDTGFLHTLVFEQLTSLRCAGSIKSIQTDIFKNFGNLSISLFLDSLGNFFHQIGIQWMSYLTNGSVVFMRTEIINYTYPDKDFCIFAKFPVNRQIQLFLDASGPNCTLTYAWLDSRMDKDICKNTLMSNDRIKSMIKQCDDVNQKSPNLYPTYPEFYQAKITNMLFLELLPFVFIPCACLIGLFLSWKIIRTIHVNKKRDLKEDFYKYMSANAKFNCLYCLILVFYPITSCNWRLSDHFCSSIFTTQFAQYYKIVMVAYWGEVFKMCANVSYLMMTLNRYMLVGKDHPAFLVKIAKLKLKRVIRGSLLFSVLINIGHGWEYKAVEDQIISNSFTSFYFVVSSQSYSDYPQANQDIPYLVCSIAYFAINFGAFFIINTAIEVEIVRRMQKEFKKRRENGCCECLLLNSIQQKKQLVIKRI
jgi:hypothetical protein